MKGAEEGRFCGVPSFNRISAGRLPSPARQSFEFYFFRVSVGAKKKIRKKTHEAAPCAIASVYKNRRNKKAGIAQIKMVSASPCTLVTLPVPMVAQRGRFVRKELIAARGRQACSQ